MKGIKFGEKHSYTDFNLILSKVDIPPATPKTTYVDIPGADGSADLTEAFGEVKYKNREGAKFTFTVLPEDDFEVKKTEISNCLNGRYFDKIVIDKDPDYYWKGRCTVDDYASNKRIHQIVVSANLSPYKFKQDKTIVPVQLCGKNLLDYTKLTKVVSSYCDFEAVDGGIKVTSTGAGASRYVMFKSIPIEAVRDKIVSVSFNAQTEDDNAVRLAIGFVNENTSKRMVMKNIYAESPSNSMTVRATYLNDYTHIGIWLYANGQNGDATVTGMSVTYTDIQIEVGLVATDYEPFTAVSPQTVTLNNGCKTVSPEVICTHDTTITVNGNDYQFNEGRHKLLDVRLSEGGTPVTVNGAGLTTFIYQECDL